MDTRKLFDLLTAKGGSLPPELAGTGGELTSYTPPLRDKLAYSMAHNWFGDTREGVEKARRLTNVMEMTPVGAATGMYDVGRDLGNYNFGDAMLGTVFAGLPLPGALKKEAKAGIKAYHGSPHSFDKFDMSQIGTGEGAQAYGHGLYFAEGEGVAKNYREQLTKSKDITVGGKPLHWVDRSVLTEYPGLFNGTMSIDDAMVQAKEMGRDGHVDLLKDIKAKGGIERPGHMYEVNIDADPEQFLDWDKPLSEQPEGVRNVLQLPPQAARLNDTLVSKGHPSMTGGNAYTEVLAASPDRGKANVSEQLKQAGIPGIKYLDAGSRAKGDGSRNYVVFDDKLVSIVRKYGIAGASTLLGYDLMANANDAQAAQLEKAQNGR